MTTLVLARGLVDGSPLSVELITPIRGSQPRVRITWPHTIECSPAKFGEAIASACRLLTSASTELARLGATTK
jgi:hypothetical protein